MTRSALAAFAVAFGLALAASGAAPGPAEQARFLEATRAAALDYSDLLPDFVCTETMRRSVAEGADSRNLDTLTFQVTYAGKKESYKLVEGNRVSGRDFYSVGGATSAGEFGSLLRWIFEPASSATFHWEKASTNHKSPVWVYSYRVPRSGSRYVLAFDGGNGEKSILVGFHGQIEIARENHRALRLTSVADDIPPGFAIQSSSTSIDYAFADVGGKPFLLPSQAETDMLYQPRLSDSKETLRNTRAKLMRNFLEFRGYRKFAVDSDIDFGGDGKP
ncbi:MAG TPA: hypothetical protein VMU19_01760 [Bryobacteraceae bacterium]|nr:hypothetical protein [Bryobacteraceae bacterium]